jgi:hypothetical protein
LALTALKQLDVRFGLVGERRLEALAVMVGEGQLRAGMRRSRPTITLEPCVHVLRSTRSVISATCPFSRSLPSAASTQTQL